eukprot:jgi/Galph1/2357/GphlegSOOS_G31.1
MNDSSSVFPILRSQDCGNVAFWEHINIDISDTDLAFHFYFQALGLTNDPYLPSQFYNRVYWANIGQQQFHLVRWNYPQVVPGKIIIQVPSLNALEERLLVVEPKLKGTKFRWSKQMDKDGQVIHLTCPWGNQLIAMDDSGVPSEYKEQILVVPFPSQLGICSLILPCAKYCARGIANFFRRVIFAQVEEPTNGKTVVLLGPRQTLIFEEDNEKQLPECIPERKEDPNYPDYHLCIYINEFTRAFEQVKEMKLLYNDHIFSDKTYELEDALENRQFRFRDILDLDAYARGERRILYQLQFETRSLYHPFYMRPLVNRMGRTGLYCFQ